MNQGPPYVPRYWTLGGANDRSVDIPITSILLVFYIFGAGIHMTIFQLNRRRGHKFLFNAVLFGFCMSRNVTCSLRLASLTHPTNIRLAIAAAIFTAAGVLILFIANLLWTQRLLRSLHPHIGWHAVPSTILKLLFGLTALTLAAVITATVQSFYTLDTHILSIDRALQLYGTTFLAVLSFLPLPIIALAFAAPSKHRPDAFGAGSLRMKTAVLVTGTVLVCLGATYRCGTLWLTPVPRSMPLPGYLHKAAFYVVDFVVEILTVYLYAIMRVDLRFHVPDGAKGPGSYSQSETLEEGKEEVRMYVVGEGV